MQSGESVSALLDIPDFHLTWPFKESVDLTFKTLCKCDIYIKIYNIYIYSLRHDHFVALFRTFGVVETVLLTL